MQALIEAIPGEIEAHLEGERFNPRAKFAFRESHTPIEQRFQIQMQKKVLSSCLSGYYSSFRRSFAPKIAVHVEI